MSSSLKRSRGAQPFGRITINQNQLQGDFQLFSNYLSDNPVYPAFMFCRRFRMQVSLCQRITEDIVGFDEYFLQKRNVSGRLGFSPSQKITLALRMMVYQCSTDSIDEYTRMSKSSSHFLAFVLKKDLLLCFFSLGESTTLECLKRFCNAIIFFIFQNISPNSKQGRNWKDP
jgi:hypothetical protein